MKENLDKESKYKKIQRKIRKAFYYNTYTQIIDNSKVIVENCKHIIECNDIMVKLSTVDYNIQIWGEELTINDYNTENVIINGKISSVELFPKGRGRNDI